MQKNRGVQFAFFAFVLALIVLSQVTFVAAQSTDPVVNMFTAWGEGNLAPTAAKWILFVIVTILILSILSQVPGIKEVIEKKGEDGNPIGGYSALGIILSALIGFLAVAYFTPNEVLGLVTSYSALGFVLGGFLPFILLLFFMIKISSPGQHDDAGAALTKRYFGYLMWGLFALFFLVRSLSFPQGVSAYLLRVPGVGTLVQLAYDSSATGAATAAPWISWMYFFLAIACLLIIWFFDNVRRSMMRQFREDQKNIRKDNWDDAAEGVGRLSGLMKKTTG